MRIEVLYFEGCPNHAPAIDVLRDTLNTFGRQDEIHQVEVRTQAEAEAMRFVGSPSIRINGSDIEPLGAHGKDLWSELSHLHRGFASRRCSIARAGPSGGVGGHS